MADLCLVAVVVGEAFERYADELAASVGRHLPAAEVSVLPGVPGWPDATLYRYHTLLAFSADLRGRYLFLVDADMRFEADVDPDEILAPLVATRHPGYVGRPRHELPYETRPESLAYVPHDAGGIYFAGGFVGGERARFLRFARQLRSRIDDDRERGVTAIWHDESYLNRLLIEIPPDLVLSPSFCYPEDDTWYRSVWPEPYERKLVAVLKTPAERGDR